jgi:hypothetical protein
MRTRRNRRDIAALESRICLFKIVERDLGTPLNDMPPDFLCDEIKPFGCWFDGCFELSNDLSDSLCG